MRRGPWVIVYYDAGQTETPKADGMVIPRRNIDETDRLLALRCQHHRIPTLDKTGDIYLIRGCVLDRTRLEAFAPIEIYGETKRGLTATARALKLPVDEKKMMPHRMLKPRIK